MDAMTALMGVIAWRVIFTRRSNLRQYAFRDLSADINGSPIFLKIASPVLSSGHGQRAPCNDSSEGVIARRVIFTRRSNLQQYALRDLSVDFNDSPIFLKSASAKSASQ
jgi:hypothetical protein